MTTDREYLASTAVFLARRSANTFAAQDAQDLHRLSGTLHRIAERQCNEDLACPKCDGDGRMDPKYAPTRRDCKACAGTGSIVGKREAKAETRVREIAAAYNCRAYFQGDPRGCAVTLVPEEIIPTDVAGLAQYVYDCDKLKPATLADLQARWIDSNYTRGFAVPRLGR